MELSHDKDYGEEVIAKTDEPKEQTKIENQNRDFERTQKKLEDKIEMLQKIISEDMEEKKQSMNTHNKKTY